MSHTPPLHTPPVGALTAVETTLLLLVVLGSPTAELTVAVMLQVDGVLGAWAAICIVAWLPFSMVSIVHRRLLVAPGLTGDFDTTDGPYPIGPRS